MQGAASGCREGHSSLRLRMSNLRPGGRNPALQPDAEDGRTALTASDRAALRSILREELAAAGEPEPLLDVGGVARRLSVSVRTVEKIIASGDLAPIWVEGSRQFDREAVEAYIRRRVRVGRARR